MSNGYQMTSTPRKYRPAPEPMRMHILTGEIVIPVKAIPFPDFRLGDPCRVFFTYDQDALLIGDDYHSGPEIDLWYPARFWFRVRGNSGRGVFILYTGDNGAFWFICEMTGEFVDTRPSIKRWTGPIPPWAQPRLEGF